MRLIDETPMMEVEVLTKHTDQVLHVSFSHDGQRFATTAKDGYIKVRFNMSLSQHFKRVVYFNCNLYFIKIGLENGTPSGIRILDKYENV